MIHAYQIGPLEPFSERVTIRVRIDRTDILHLQPVEIASYRRIIANRMCIVLDGRDLPSGVPVNRGSVIVDSDCNEWRVIEDTPRLAVPQSGGGQTSVLVCPVERIYSIRSHAPTMAATA